MKIHPNYFYSKQKIINHGAFLCKTLLSVDIQMRSLQGKKGYVSLSKLYLKYDNHCITAKIRVLLLTLAHVFYYKLLLSRKPKKLPLNQLQINSKITANSY